MFSQPIFDFVGDPRIDGYYACLSVPAFRMTDPDIHELVCGLGAALETSGLGRIAGTSFARPGTDSFEPIRITLSLASDDPTGLHMIAATLQGLALPAGSTIGNAECPDMITLGGGDLILTAAPARAEPLHGHGERLQRLNALLAAQCLSDLETGTLVRRRLH